VLSAIVLASVTVATIGCSHDTLGSGTQGLNMTYTPDPAGAGRYDSASFDITKIQALPVDPATAAIYGSEALLLRFDRFRADLTATNAVAYSQIALATGTYSVKLIGFTPPALSDDVVSATPATCIDGVGILDRQSVFPPIAQAFDFVDPASLTFTVNPGQTTLALRVNVPGLIAGYESSFTCQTGCGPGGDGGANCVTAFDAANFSAVLLDNVRLE
jgi:hypothetical protein